MAKGVKKPRMDKELEEFRSLMKPPGTFDDGFSWAAFLGALFVALMMVPGSIYMTLVAGMGVGPAAQWVTVILFIEVARRAHKTMGRAELFTLFYISGALIGTAAVAQGNFHGGMGALWAQFYAQSDAANATGIAERLPSWVAPTDPAVIEKRSLFMVEWLPVIGLIVFTMIMGRLDNMVLGYGLFRITSDIEKLPFPMAPVGAQGILALAEEQEEETKHEIDLDAPLETDESGEPSAKSWRWRVFSIGSMMGLVFGLVYLGVPIITGALLGDPITLIPIPFIDYTQQTGEILPASAVGIALDAGLLLSGMVLPFWAMVGSFVGLLVTWIVNPILYDGGILQGLGYEGGVLNSWKSGDNMQETFYKNNVDFYFSFSIGVGLAIAIAGFISVGKAYYAAKQRAKLSGESVSDEFTGVPEGRGDIKGWLIGAVYFVSTALYIAVSCWLLYITDGHVPTGVIVIMLFYAFIYTPIISYVTARLEGIAGEVIAIPFVREATFILSGYQGVAIWFLPIPFHNYGSMTVFYRQAELTGTSFWSIWKSELLLTPIVLVGSLVFAHFIWQLGDIPSSQYPYAQEWWEVTAAQQSLVFSSTLGGFSEFEQAINGGYIFVGLVLGGVCFAGLSWLGAPTFLTYGIVRGLNQTLPFWIIPQFIGALIGRYYFQKRMGLMWRQYVPVVFAGFSCGVGLIGTLGIGFTFLTKAVFKLPY